MGQALYRTYRSKTLSEIIGQEHITTTLERALKKGSISHAYLFTGPRGTGKTSIARILAHEINSLPYDEQQHLDIIEIDAASNRRIDEIRDLRDKVHTAPSSAKYKVYIIDEVHMLTKEAFNALLKTLEEPPAHVVFMLATTEAHKLPETIISRTQRFSLKPVELPKVTAHLRSIADKESITIDDEALGLIAAHGGGSFRDSISLLDQARNMSDHVTLADIQAMLGIAPDELITSLLEALTIHDAPSVARLILQLKEQGYEPAQVARQLSAAVRQQIIGGSLTLPHATAIQMLERLVQVPASHDPATSLEITVLDAALASVAAKPIVAGHTAHVIPAPVMKMPAVPTPPKPTPEPVKRPAAHTQPTPSAATRTHTSTTTLDDASWQAVLEQLKKHHAALYATARATKATFEPGAVTLHFNYGFHQKRFNDKRNKEAMLEILHTTTGEDMLLHCVVDETAEPAAGPPVSNETVHAVAPIEVEPAPQVSPEPPSKAVDAISNIFGSAEVLES